MGESPVALRRDYLASVLPGLAERRPVVQRPYSRRGSNFFVRVLLGGHSLAISVASSRSAT
jgi:hypothetical protein